MENDGVDNATTQVHTVALPDYFCFLFCYFWFYFGVKFLCWICFFRLWFEPSLMIYKTFASVLHWNTYVSIMKFKF